MFQIKPLSTDLFSHLYGLSDDVLKARGVLAQAAEGPGFPCRVALRDAEPAERVLLLNYLHQPADTPFRAAHGIYVIDGAETLELRPGDLPPVMRQGRMLSLRAFGGDGMLKAAELCGSEETAEFLDHLLARDDSDYVQIHYAKYGCYAATAVRI
ncbi:MAG: DUF1203 domain-containing protein [Asticcacaulis sp.]